LCGKSDHKYYIAEKIPGFGRKVVTIKVSEELVEKKTEVNKYRDKLDKVSKKFDDQ